jgi:small multidrug resistance pump
MNPWLAISIAIAAEVLATSALKASQELTKLWPSLCVVLGYGISFYFMTLSLRTIPVGVMYAIWSGVGIVAISFIGWIVYKQYLDLPAIIGIALIVLGVVVINLFSKTVAN